MKKFTKISKNISVGPQPDENTLQEIAKKGFKSVINLQRAGEFSQLFKPEEEQEAVESHGMRYLHFPVSLSNVKPTHVDELAQQVKNLEKPIYIHCRIGQRSEPVALLLHARRRGLGLEAVQEKAAKLGFLWKAPMINDFVKRCMAVEATA